MFARSTCNEISFQDDGHRYDCDLMSYKVLAPLGHGACGFVYKIQSFKTSELFALKVIDKKTRNFKSIETRLQKEVNIHSALDHPHIIRLLRSFEDEQNYYLLMELAAGGELHTYVKQRERLIEEEIVDIAFQLASGVKHLHDNSIIHRDLKLKNILLTCEGTVKIADFGLSTRVTEEHPECYSFCGTPNYIAPEVLTQQGYGMKSDIWSFGCMLFSMACGYPPFLSESALQTIQNVKEGKLTLPSHVSATLKDLLVHTIEWDTAKRFSIDQVIAHPFFTTKISKKLWTSAEVPEWTSPRFNAPVSIPSNSTAFTTTNNCSIIQKPVIVKKKRSSSVIESTANKENDAVKVNAKLSANNQSQMPQDYLLLSSELKANIKSSSTNIKSVQQQIQLQQQQQQRQQLIQCYPQHHPSSYQLQYYPNNLREFSSKNKLTSINSQSTKQPTLSQLRSQVIDNSVKDQCSTYHVKRKTETDVVIAPLHLNKQKASAVASQGSSTQNVRRTLERREGQKSLYDIRVITHKSKEMLPQSTPSEYSPLTSRKPSQTSQHIVTATTTDYPILSRERSISHNQLKMLSSLEEKSNYINDTARTSRRDSTSVTQLQSERLPTSSLLNSRRTSHVMTDSDQVNSEVAMTERSRRSGSAYVSRSSVIPLTERRSSPALITRNSFNDLRGSEMATLSREGCRATTVVSPLSTRGIGVSRVGTKNGLIEVHANNWMSIECQGGALIFNISPEGTEIRIEKQRHDCLESKSYMLSELPSRYQKIYTYAKVVCATLQSKVPQVKLTNSEGNFILLSSKPAATYHVRLASGIRVTHTIGTHTMTVLLPDTLEIHKIDLASRATGLKQQETITIAVKKALKYLSECTQKMNEKYIQNFC